MSLNNNLSVFDIVEKHIESAVKSEIEERIVHREIPRIEAALRATIKTEIDKIIFEKIENIRDCSTMQEEIRIFLKWDEGSN